MRAFVIMNSCKTTSHLFITLKNRTNNTCKAGASFCYSADDQAKQQTKMRTRPKCGVDRTLAMERHKTIAILHLQLIKLICVTRTRHTQVYSLSVFYISIFLHKIIRQNEIYTYCSYITARYLQVCLN